MSILREPIDTITYRNKYEETYEDLMSKLNELHIEIGRHDKKKGEIVVRFLAKIFDMLIWQCWSDKLIFEIKEVDENRTKVSIFAVPNLFRIKIKKGEKVADPHKLVSQLKLIGQRGKGI